jgi:hypothetical protein
MPLIGFILGLTQINRNRHGIWVVLLSVVAFIVYFSLIANRSGGGGGRYGGTY